MCACDAIRKSALARKSGFSEFLLVDETLCGLRGGKPLAAQGMLVLLRRKLELAVVPGVKGLRGLRESIDARASADTAANFSKPGLVGDGLLGERSEARWISDDAARCCNAALFAARYCSKPGLVGPGLLGERSANDCKLVPRGEGSKLRFNGSVR